jgi:hypothetical protein
MFSDERYKAVAIGAAIAATMAQARMVTFEERRMRVDYL